MGGCFQHFHFSSSFILQPRFNKLQFQHQHELPQAVLPPVEPPRISNFSCLGQDRCTNLLPWMPSKIVRLKYQLNRPSHYGVEMEKQRGIRRASECSASNQHKAVEVGLCTRQRYLCCLTSAIKCQCLRFQDFLWSDRSPGEMARERKGLQNCEVSIGKFLLPYAFTTFMISLIART
jgi:hypothetical protein